mmetsp:Transcript_18848/g.34982  ORF Transcript_18848/g.34982 Transcript_18848/m.34982 type:complete len:531 (+) Transcript_18848:666-2258(+)
MQHHAARNGVAVTVIHSGRDRSGASQHVGVGELALRPESAAAVADAGVVAQHLSECAAVEPFEDDEARALGGRAGADEGDYVGMIELRVDLQLPLDLVDRQRQILTLWLERLDDDRPAVHDGRVDPIVPSVRQILDVLQSVPSKIELRSRDAHVVGVMTRRATQCRDRGGALCSGRGTCCSVRRRHHHGPAVAPGHLVARRLGQGGVAIVGLSVVVVEGRLVDGNVLGDGGNGRHGRREGHVRQELHRVRPHDGPAYGEEDDGHVGPTGFVTDGYGRGRPDVADGTPQGLRSLLGGARHPHDVLRLLGPLAQRGTQSVGPLRALISVVDIDQCSADGVLQGSRAEVGVGELVRLGPRPQPHFGDVEAEALAGGAQHGVHGGMRAVEERVLVQGGEDIFVRSGTGIGGGVAGRAREFDVRRLDDGCGDGGGGGSSRGRSGARCGSAGWRLGLTQRRESGAAALAGAALHHRLLSLLRRRSVGQVVVRRHAAPPLHFLSFIIFAIDFSNGVVVGKRNGGGRQRRGVDKFDLH